MAGTVCGRKCVPTSEAEAETLMEFTGINSLGYLNKRFELQETEDILLHIPYPISATRLSVPLRSADVTSG